MSDISVYIFFHILASRLQTSKTCQKKPHFDIFPLLFRFEQTLSPRRYFATKKKQAVAHIYFDQNLFQVKYVNVQMYMYIHSDNTSDRTVWKSSDHDNLFSYQKNNLTVKGLNKSSIFAISRANKIFSWEEDHGLPLISLQFCAILDICNHMNNSVKIGSEPIIQAVVCPYRLLLTFRVGFFFNVNVF